MNQQQFEARHRAEWRAFSRYLDTLEQSALARRWRRAPAASAGEPAGLTLPAPAFPGAYRRLCAQLALARERRYSARLLDELGQLALRGHQQLYRSHHGRFSVGAIGYFFAVEFPRLVRDEAVLFWLCSLLFYGPLLLMGLAVYADPALVYTLLDAASVEQMEAMYRPGETLTEGRTAESDVAMFGVYIYNNIGIGFRTFASGIVFAIGTVFILLFNGVYIGAVAGYLSGLGYGITFYPFVIAHGAFELTAIVLAGAAGMRLGLALLAPGRLPRLTALKYAAQRGVRLIYGVLALLLLAAFIEAFWSSKDELPNAVRYTAGAVCWLAVIVYLLAAGRGRE